LVINPLFSLEIFFAAFLAGLLGSLTGLGGGVVLTPLLVLLLGVPIQYALGTSLISTISTSSGSASAYVKDELSNMKVGIALEIRYHHWRDMRVTNALHNRDYTSYL